MREQKTYHKHSTEFSNLNYSIKTYSLKNVFSIQFDLEDLPHGQIFVIHYKEYKELDSHLRFK